MDWMLTAALAAALALCVYLLAALLKPESFS